MKVFYVYDGQWPHNAIRAVKHLDSLTRAGHSVTLLSRGPVSADDDRAGGGLRIRRMPMTGHARVDRLLTYPLFLNPMWSREILRGAKESCADCIIVGDLPLAPSAVWAGGRLGIPVYYDMAEVYPIALHTMLPHEAGLAIRVARSTHAAEAVERWVLRRVRSVFVVSEESRARCLSLGVPTERVVLVGNTPINAEELGRSDWPVPADIADIAGRPLAIFIGNLFADRGVRYAIEAIGLVAQHNANATLLIIGDGRERARLEAQVAEQGLSANVRFLGWKHHREHAAYLRQSQVGLLPFLKTRHICITLANKLFDYMAAGIPVLASDVPPMRRVIEETASGVLCPAADAPALAHELNRLFADRALRESLGANGRAAIAEQYAWTNDARRFMDAIEGGHSMRAAV